MVNNKPIETISIKCWKCDEILENPSIRVLIDSGPEWHCNKCYKMHCCNIKKDVKR